MLYTLFLQKTLIVYWERDQTSSGLYHLTPTQLCYPEWPLSTAPPRHLAPQPGFSHPAYPFAVKSTQIFNLSSPATFPPPLHTPATHLPCTHPVDSQQPLEAWTHPWLVRCHLTTMPPCRLSTVSAPGACRTFYWRETPVMTSTRSIPVWLTCSCKVRESETTWCIENKQAADMWASTVVI